MIHASTTNSLAASAPDAARQLLGWQLVRTDKDGELQLIGRIVETEAYDQTDAASHSYKGSTTRTAVMFGPAGHLYVYFTYGMHYCCNVVVGPEGQGAAVLIRAVEPLVGMEQMRSNRTGIAVGAGHLLSYTDIQLTNGPAKLCQAFGIDKALNGHDLCLQPLTLQPPQDTIQSDDIVQTTRIGIRQAADTPWRFYIRDNPYVSKR